MPAAKQSEFDVASAVRQAKAFRATMSEVTRSIEATSSLSGSVSGGLGASSGDYLALTDELTWIRREVVALLKFLGTGR